MAATDDYRPPATRRLRVYAFDPQASLRLATAAVNRATIHLPWEESWEDPVTPGPVNEYLEVIDVDPVSGQFYRPLDLNHPHLLAQDGLEPSEGDPRFHQQMVFAVAMKTIKAFERALGRRIFWSPEWNSATESYEPVRKLRVYPHALREPNAYYSREKKALLFGYFRASATDPGSNLPGGWVFTALSHDIIVHETTHAILDGLHRRYAEATHVDSIAFHEAFADIVALLSHFTLPEAVAGEIARQSGRLGDQSSALSELARQFGEATGRYAALRNAIDDKGPDGQPDATRLSKLTEPHDRGAVLVAAVFDAFVQIYERRTADLMRLAASTGGEAPRNLHPDLVARLTSEATKAADHVLRMCIRALDYLPPVDVRFGEFLRAIVTADTDLVPDDRLNYRLAIIEAFRRRGILPEHCLSLAPDSLLWSGPESDATAKLEGAILSQLDLTPRFRRTVSQKISEENRHKVWRWLIGSDGDDKDAEWERALGVFFSDRRHGKPWRYRTISHWPASGKKGSFARTFPAVEVHSVRTTRRSGPDGQDLRQLVIEVTQRRRGFLNDTRQDEQDDPAAKAAVARPDFIFRGGATIIVDLRDDDGTIRYIIRKSIDDDVRMAGQREFEKTRRSERLGMTYGKADEREGREPFALAHRGA